MVIEISEKYVAENTQGFTQNKLRATIALARVIDRGRWIVRRLNRRAANPGNAECRVTGNFDRAAGHFHEHRWAFVENSFSDDFHSELESQWPGRYELHPPTSLTKSYDTGLACRMTDDSPDTRRHEKYPALMKWLRYLRTDECSQRFGAVLGEGSQLRCSSFLMQMTREGSQVVPHKDGRSSTVGDVVNILVFVRGEGGPGGGGLPLSRDNELKDIIFESHSVRNTALLYDVRANFFHGFRPVVKGKSCWSMSSEFVGQRAQ